MTTTASETFSTDVPIPVRGAPVRRDTLVISVTAAGQAAAWREARVTSQVSGRVQRVAVRESDVVGAGRVLVRIDSAEHVLALQRARAELASAEATFREQTLFDDRIEDPQIRAERERVARARSGLDRARVNLLEAEMNLRRVTLGAPFAGHVADLRVVPGEWVTAGRELMTVQSVDPIKVEVQVLESEVGFLRANGRATVTFSAFPGETFEGRVETINPIVDRDTRTARVTVRVPNPQRRIMPGMYARVSLEARKFPDRVLVPRTAVLERDQRRELVFVLDGAPSGGRAKWLYVTTGMRNDSLVELVSHPDTFMPNVGDIVLVDGHHTLIHDARVQVVENVRAAGGRPQ